MICASFERRLNLIKPIDFADNLLNTGIAHAKDPVRMAIAMRAACEAGYHGARAGRIAKRLYATASSPWDGVISPIPGE